MNAFYCSGCRGRFERGGDCPTCKNETLFNLRDQDVHEFLMDQDAKRDTRRFGVMAVAAVPGVLAAYGLFVTAADLFSHSPHRISGVLALCFGAVMVASVAGIFVIRRRPKIRIYPQLHPSEVAELLPGSTLAPRNVRATLKDVPDMASLMGNPARTRKLLGGKVAKVCVIRATEVTMASRGGGTGTRSSFQSFLVDSGGEVHDLEEGDDGGSVVMSATSLAQLLDVPFEDARYG